MLLFSFPRREAMHLLLFIYICLQLVECTVDFFGAHVAELNVGGQYATRYWMRGVPGDGFFGKQPSGSLALSPTARVYVGTLSAVMLNEDGLLSMDKESSLYTETWSNVLIYGRLNIGKRSVISGGRYTHLKISSNGTFILGDDSQIEFDCWTSIYVMDNFSIGADSSIRLGERSRIQVSACQPQACGLGDETRLTLRESSAFEISGTLIQLPAANITIGRMARLTMEADTSLAAGLGRPAKIHLGEQSVLQVRKGTHCLLLDDLLIAEQTTFVLEPDLVDKHIKCFDFVNSNLSIMKVLKKQDKTAKNH